MPKEQGSLDQSAPRSPANEVRRRAVLFAIPALDKGGPDRVLFELIRRIDRERFAPSLVVSNDSGYYLDRLPADVVVHVLRAERTVYDRYPVLPLLRLVRRTRPDLVLSTLRMNMTAGLARPLFPRATRLIVRVANQKSTNFAELRQAAPLKHRISFHLDQFALSRADRIVCQSSDMADDLKALGIRVPLTVIGNPVDVGDVQAQATPCQRLPGSPSLFSAGRLSAQKGFDILLPAFARLRRRFPDAVLTIAGDGPDRARLEAMRADLSLGDAVRFLGFVVNPYPMMAGADLFVLASRYEGFPNVVLEALACGTPAVATDCPGGTRDLVQPGVTGWLARPEDVDDLASALDLAAAGYDRLDGLQLQQIVADRFAAERIVSAYEQALMATAAVT